MIEDIIEAKRNLDKQIINLEDQIKSITRENEIAKLNIKKKVLSMEQLEEKIQEQKAS